MAQRKPTPITPAVTIVPDDSALVPADPLARAAQRPHAPTRAQLMAERQALQMQFQAARSQFAISKTMEVVDHATAELTASLAYSKHLERGFGEEQTAQEREYYQWLRQLAFDASAAITAETAEMLRAMARELGLPDADVTSLDVVIRWLMTH